MDSFFETLFSRLEPFVKASDEGHWDDKNVVFVIGSDDDKTGVFVAGGKSNLVAALADAIARDRNVERIIRKALRLVQETRPEKEPAHKPKRVFLGDLTKKPTN